MDGTPEIWFAVVGERPPLQVEAPRQDGGDPHVDSPPEPALPFDELGFAIDSQAARPPRTDGQQVVDDDRHLGVPSPHIAVFPALGGSEAAHVHVRPVELEHHRHDVRPAAGRDGGDAGQPLGPQVGDLFFAERHPGLLKLAPGDRRALLVTPTGIGRQTAITFTRGERGTQPSHRAAHTHDLNTSAARWPRPSQGAALVALTLSPTWTSEHLPTSHQFTTL